MQENIARALKSLLKFAIRIYQVLLAPILGNNCRFHPNCSSYTIEAIDKHGLVAGLWLSTKRITRCNPWHHGGLDPVPANDTAKIQDKTITISSGGVLNNDR